MSATTVVLKYDDMGLCIPSVPKVLIETGAQVTFTAPEGQNAVLYFSPATTAILSPTPGTPVSISPGQSVTFSFSSGGSAAYGVFCQPPSFKAPDFFDFGAPQTPPVLVIEPGLGGIGFSVASNPPSTHQ